jgi:hypothetical protein
MITIVEVSPESKVWTHTDVDYENMKAHVQQRESDGKWYARVEINHKNGHESLTVTKAICDSAEEAEAHIAKLFPGIGPMTGVCDVYCGETEDLVQCEDCGVNRCREHVYLKEAEEAADDVVLCLPCLRKREEAEQEAAVKNA